MRWLKKILKLAGILVVALFLLLLLIAGVIRIPAVQQNLAGKGMRFLENKTGGDFSVETVYLDWPLSVTINGLLIREPKGDTLLYAGYFHSGISLPGILKGNIAIGNTSLQHATIKLQRSERDSTFNFDFIVKAFSDTAQKDTTSSDINLSFTKINLSDIRFLMNDGFGGMTAKVDLGEANLNFNNTDINTLEFDFKEISLKNTSAKIFIAGADVVNDTLVLDDSVKAALPIIKADDFHLEDINLTFAAGKDSSALHGHIGTFSFSEGNINPNIQHYTFESIVLSNSNIAMVSEKGKNAVENTDTVSTASGASTLMLKANKITLSNNYIRNNSPYSYSIPFYTFNPSNLNIQKLDGEITNVQYSAGNSSATINRLSFSDSSKFSLINLTVKASMTEESVDVQDLEILTKNTAVKGAMNFKYESIEALQNDPGNTSLNVDVEIPKAGIGDIIYWVPALANKSSLHKAAQNISLTLAAEGKVDDLAIRHLVLNYGLATSVMLKGHLKGLPDPATLAYAIPQLDVSTDATELKQLLPTNAWPEGIIMPRFINLRSQLKGNAAGTNASLGLATDAGILNATVDLDFKGDTSYMVMLKTANYKLNKLLGDSSGMGETAFLLNVRGHGFDPNKLIADVELELDRLQFKEYMYHNFDLDVKYNALDIAAKAIMNDSALAFDLEGSGSLKKDAEYIKLNMDLKGADLLRMNISPEDLRLSAQLTADLTGNNSDNLNGTAGITKLIIAKHEKTYVLDSLIFASVNEEGKSSMKFTSAVLTLDFDGNVKPGDLADAFKHQLNHYYPFFPPYDHTDPQHFTLNLQVRNHPVFNEIFLEDLTDFLPASINTEFNSENHVLKLDVSVPRVRYGNQRIENFKVNVAGDADALLYTLRLEEAGAGSYGLENFLAQGRFGGNSGNIRLQEGIKQDDKDVEEDFASLGVDSGEVKEKPRSKKLDMELVLTALEDRQHQVHFVSPMTLGSKDWVIPEDNYIRTASGEEKIFFNHLLMESGDERLSLDNKDKDLRIEMANFNLTNISGLISKDTFPVAGALNGFVLFKRDGDATALESDVTLASLEVMAVPVGDLNLNARQTGNGSFDFNVALSGNENDMKIDGKVASIDTVTSFDINGKLNNLNAAIFNGLSFGALKETAGAVQGEFSLAGTSIDPKFNGSVSLKGFTTIPDATGVRVYVQDETIQITPTLLTIPDFLITDSQKGTMNISGKVALDQFSPGALDIEMRARDFTVFNTPRTKDALYYGTLRIGGRIHAGGDASLPEVEATVRINEDSDFAVVVPQSRLSTDKGEEVITFRDSTQLHPIITRGESELDKGKAMQGFSIDSRLTIDEKARFRLLIDPSTGDSLTVSGAATIAFSMNPSGDVTLSGLYQLKEGSYFTSLQDVLQKRFLIQDGSTIRWNGEPLDAELDIDAVYRIRTSPVDLISGQISGLSDAEQSQYKQRLEFLVFLQLDGQLLKPDISFRIEVGDQDRGAMGGIVDTRLRQINEDPSELNKQVFALLLLNRFVQEDPLATASGSSGAEGIARSSVSRFLSDQLNQLAGRYIAGAELTFNVESYEDYSQGDPQGRTEVGVALKKQFLDERFSVQVGGGFDVEGEATRTNQLSDITGDVLVEYKLTEDGRFRASGFRRNEFQDVLEGQVTETGVGILYMKDFNRWKNFFQRSGRNRQNEKSRD